MPFMGESWLAFGTVAGLLWRAMLMGLAETAERAAAMAMMDLKEGILKD
jgi:hypothetical protein